MKNITLNNTLCRSLLCVVFLTPVVSFAETPQTTTNTLKQKEKMKSIIVDKLTVWTKEKQDGTAERVFVAHCRRSKFGCEKRVEYFVDYIYHYSEIYGLDPVMMTAVAWHESRFSAFVKGPVGERGIFQINPRAKWGKALKFVMSEHYRNKCKKKAGECQDEVTEKAAWLFSRCLKKCGNNFSALGLYNTGRCDGNSRYSRKVLKYYREFIEKLAN